MGEIDLGSEVERICDSTPYDSSYIFYLEYRDLTITPTTPS
jgi:hypothetical protein